MKPTNTEQMLGFIYGILALNEYDLEEISPAFEITDHGQNFKVYCKFTHEIDEYGNQKRTYADSSFTWLKSESLQKLITYISCVEEELCNVEVINNYK